MAITKALTFVMAAVLLLAALILNAQAPVPSAGKCTVRRPQYEPRSCALEFTVTPVYPAKR